jgi:hypothetical protein
MRGRRDWWRVHTQDRHESAGPIVILGFHNLRWKVRRMTSYD